MYLVNVQNKLKQIQLYHLLFIQILPKNVLKYKLYIRIISK